MNRGIEIIAWGGIGKETVQMFEEEIYDTTSFID